MPTHTAAVTESELQPPAIPETPPRGAVDAPSVAFFADDPAALGLPVFVASSVALALILIGYVPAAAAGASLPIIAAATGVGLTVSTVWAAAVGQSVVASVFGIFAGFWLSYATLVLGLTHKWFAIPAAAAVHTQALFLITWLVIIGMLTVATLRLPLAFTVLFALVEVALALVLAATVNASVDLSKAAGAVVFAFAAVGGYLYMGVAALATGGPGVPLGRPVQH